MPIDCEIAHAHEDRDQVYRLRYGCYFGRGSIPPRGDRRFSDRFDDLPNHFSFLLRSDAWEPLATVRIGVVISERGWTESPSGTVFGDHPAYRALARESFVEASRLCFGAQARRDALMGLVGNLAAFSDFFGCEWLAACPRQEHAPIYQRLFGFRPLAAPRRYFGVDFETQFLGIRREELRENVRSVKPMTTAWVAALARLQQSLGSPQYI